jgi:hypothetical protein
MSGLKILDVVVGLMFVYLLLSLLASAIKEYIASVMNLRGKELARGIGRLLEDLDAGHALERAFEGLKSSAASEIPSLTQRFYNHPLIRPLATRRGRLFGWLHNAPRLPSYIPARTFALALLDVLGYRDPAADDPAPDPGSKAAVLVNIMKLLKRESPLDLSELKIMLEKANMPAEAVARILESFTGAQSRLQHLHDGVEVWFNNAMDRVSGAYKRNVQGWLLVIGFTVAGVTNADTIQMWHQLAGNEELRAAMVERATATLPTMDAVVNHPAADSLTQEQARERYRAASALVSEMDFQLGWSRAEGMGWPESWQAGILKILGLLLTAVAISLGAPFWFDLLNKVISIRGAGRSPEEKPKSPRGPAKRAAEQTPK